MFNMAMNLVNDDYRALAEFRYQIRRFLTMSEEIARNGGLQPQQYLTLLMLRGLPPEKEPTLLTLAERLQIRHNSAVELANRLATRSLIRRFQSKNDSRKVLIRLTPKGAALIEKLVRKRFIQLHSSQPALVRALNQVLTRAKSKSTKLRLEGLAKTAAIRKRNIPG
jgi:DNA-binding MarR family transcriptional regulator